eukprot:7385964-Alexandrium_andersonii.AAC.1
MSVRRLAPRSTQRRRPPRRLPAARGGRGRKGHLIAVLANATCAVGLLCCWGRHARCRPCLRLHGPRVAHGLNAARVRALMGGMRGRS